MSPDGEGPRPLRGLRVDLSAGRISDEELPAELVLRFLGGRGLGAYILLKERIYEADPLSPDNLLIFAPGPLTGSGAPASDRYSLSSRSPLTGTVFDGNSGGSFGVALRRLGLDYLIVTGACPAPTVLEVRRRGIGEIIAPCASGTELLAGGPASLSISLRSADGIWGLEVPPSLAAIRALSGGCDAAVIGPAGERGVRFASVANDRGRQIGRGGLGAVMGSKRLKAIAVNARGGRLPHPADSRTFETVTEEGVRRIAEHPVTAGSLPRYGTSILVNVLDQAGVLPTRNYRESQFEHAEEISGEALSDAYVEQRLACHGCVIGCAGRTTVNGRSGRSPEYETVWALGADCGVGDLAAIVEANDACNRAGLDTITMGATIACAMELTEIGALAGGPRFGDAAAVLRLVQATAERRGLGDELAEGSARFAARHGRQEFSMSVKHLEMPAYDPRGMTAQGLAYATSNRGACHLRANMLGPELLGVPVLIDRFATLGKADLLIEMQDLNAVLDSLAVCKFTVPVMDHGYYARLLSAVVGTTLTPPELLRIGTRIWTAERLFNLHAGFTRAADMLPRRLLEEPVVAGPSSGHVVDLEPMLDEYYAGREWDSAGRPSARSLADLGLDWAAAGLDIPPGKPRDSIGLQSGV